MLIRAAGKMTNFAGVNRGGRFARKAVRETNSMMKKQIQ